MAGLAVNSETSRQQFAGRQAFGDMQKCSGQVKEQTEGAKETKERPNWLEKGASEETTGP